MEKFWKYFGALWKSFDYWSKYSPLCKIKVNFLPYVPWIIFNKKTKQWLGKCYISDGFMSLHTNTEGKKQQKSSNIGSLTKNNTYQKFQIWYRTESEVDSYKWLLEDAFDFFLTSISLALFLQVLDHCMYFFRLKNHWIN